MSNPLKIGIIGDFDHGRQSQTKTNEALDHVSKKLSISIDTSWLPTNSIVNQAVCTELMVFHAIWAGPGDYINPTGALNAIKICREQQWPFIGTWAGFQHALLEYALNVLDIQNASHEETNPQASAHIINKLNCSLVGETQSMNLIPGTRAFQAYGKDSIVERFQCNYGLNENYRNNLNDGTLKVTGFDIDGNARIIEIPSHRFFLAVLYLPQLSSEAGTPHPLILSFVKAAIRFKNMK